MEMDIGHIINSFYKEVDIEVKDIILTKIDVTTVEDIKKEYLYFIDVYTKI